MSTPRPGSGARGLLFVCLIMIGSLLALTGLRQLFLDPIPSTGSNIAWFVIQIVPLLVIIPGMLRLQYRSCFYTILVALLYFIHGVMLAVGESLRQLGYVEVGVSLLLILAATYLLRGLRREEAAQP